MKNSDSKLVGFGDTMIEAVRLLAASSNLADSTDSSVGFNSRFVGGGVLSISTNKCGKVSQSNGRKMKALLHFIVLNILYLGF